MMYLPDFYNFYDTHCQAGNIVDEDLRRVMAVQ